MTEGPILNEANVSAFLSFTLRNSGLRSSHGYFITLPGKKFKIDNFYYHRINKLLSYLLRKRVLTFSISLQKFKWKLTEYLTEMLITKLDVESVTFAWKYISAENKARS